MFKTIQCIYRIVNLRFNFNQSKKARLYVDKVTNSIEETTTGKFFETDMVLIAFNEIMKVYNKGG